MSEKRFSFINDGVCWIIKDNAKREILSSVSSIVDLLNEQQSTISQLQDLCGQSDGENAKLRIENKRLQEENEQLQKERILLEYQLKVQDRIIEEYEGG